jgi:lipopolysaccharide export LptBFGC system permease protein LptF
MFGAMPGEGLETAELREQMEEHAHHAAHGGREHGGGASWTMYLSLSTAIIAVFAAVASLQSGANESEALLKKSEAVLKQAEASDTWAYFQAKGTKIAIYEAQAESLEGLKDDVAAKFRKKAAGYEGEKEAIKKKAEGLENEVKESNESAEVYLHKHHRFALAVTVFQISIALAAIAALTKRKALWVVGMGAGCIGIAVTALGFLGK